MIVEGHRMDTSLDKSTTNLGTSGVNLNMVKMFWNEKMEIVEENRLQKTMWPMILFWLKDKCIHKDMEGYALSC